MRATVHVDRPRVLNALRQTVTTPIPPDTRGLRMVRAMTPAPLAATRLPRPQLSGLTTITFWDDDESIDAYEAEHPPSNAGWSARLELIRAVPVAGGHFPGVPSGLTAPDVDNDRPVVVVTIALTRVLRFASFLRVNRQAESSLADSPGLLWGTGLANLGQRCLATLSLWDSGTNAHAYAVKSNGHRFAMRNESKQSFHRRGSFLRFRPLRASGSVDGTNPLPAAINAELLADATV